VLPYARQIQVSQVIRTQLEQNLLRAMLDKMASDRMFSHVATDYKVLHALASACSVDSSFTNSQLEAMALRLSHLRGNDGTFITAPTIGGSAPEGSVYLRKRLTRRLWSAIRHDSVARYAQHYPFTVTPGAPG
jgi:hypothetical protein